MKVAIPHDIRQITRPHSRLLTLYALRTLTLLCLGPWFLVVFLPFLFRYMTLRYRFDDEGVGMSYGVLWRRETYLTYARIQDIHLSRGLFERWLGLATIRIQTASGSSAAEVSIEGLMEYEAIRDALYSKMRGAHEGAPQKSPDEDPALALLTEIRDELRGLSQDLRSRQP